MKQYVQHISGQGEKWEVVFVDELEYEVVAKSGNDGNHWLPTSEYRLCDPPEEWEDVTEDVQAYPWSWGKNHVSHENDGTFYLSEGGSLVKKETHRVRKIDGLHNGPAFIVERKKS